MKALITGIHGAAGSYLSEHLRAGGDEVHGLARPGCDLTDFDVVRAEVKRIAPDVIYHLASDADVAGSFNRAAELFENNTKGTINLLEAVRLSNRNPVVVVGSTSEVYGDTDVNPITEDTPFSMPTNPYAASKQSQDMLAQFYAAAYRMHIVITRAFSYVNPRRDDLALSAFAKQIAAIEKGEADELVHGPLQSIRTFCDVRCIIEAYAMAAKLPGVRNGSAAGGIYNIGSERPVMVRDCLDELIYLARVPITTRLDPARVRPIDVRHSVPDCSRFRTLTAWTPRRKLGDSLRWLLDHYRARPA